MLFCYKMQRDTQCKDTVMYVTRWINLNSTMNNWINYNGWLVNWFENGWFFKIVQRFCFVSLLDPIADPMFTTRRNLEKMDARMRRKKSGKNHRRIIVSTPIAMRQNVIAVVSNHLNWRLCYSVSLHWLRYIDNFIFSYYNFILFVCLFMRFEMRDLSICSSAIIWIFLKKKTTTTLYFVQFFRWVLVLSMLRTSLYHFLTFFPLLYSITVDLRSCKKNYYCTCCDWRRDVKQGLTENVMFM